MGDYRMGSAWVKVGQEVPEYAVNAPCPGRIGQDEYRDRIALVFRLKMQGICHVLPVALFQLGKDVRVAADKVKRGLETGHFPIQSVRGEMQVVNAAAVTVVIDIDAQVFQGF